MARCQGITLTRHRCKKCVPVKGGFCNIHDKSIICTICKINYPVHERTVLCECGHIFCKECILVFYEQICDGFSTEDVLTCPVCSVELDDKSWKSVTSVLCDSLMLKRRIVKYTYLSHDVYVRLFPILKLNFEYCSRGLHRLLCHYNNRTYIPRYYAENPLNTTHVDIVYFEKLYGGVNELGSNLGFKFFLGYDSPIKLKYWDFHAELTEYVFHPSRIKSLEMLD
jgi:hypothetical protein